MFNMLLTERVYYIEVMNRTWFLISIEAAVSKCQKLTNGKNSGP